MENLSMSLSNPRNSLDIHKERHYRRLLLLNEFAVKHKNEDISVPKKVTLWENTISFFNFSSIHGLKHSIDDSLNIVERIFFIISFIFAIILCVIFGRDIYLKWMESSIIIGISPMSTLVEDIPFPAITICNMNQVSLSKVQNITPRTIEYSFIETLCSRDSDFKYSTDAFNNWKFFRSFLLTATQDCSELLLSCRFGDVDMNCDDLFRSVLTDEGFCCSFNMMAPKYMFRDPISGAELIPGKFNPKGIHAVKWTPEIGYTLPLPSPQFFPFKIPGSGARFGLRLLLNANISDYYCSSTHSAGFKILVHSPIEAPKVTDYAIPIDVGDETKIIVTPRLSDATKALTDMKMSLRRCLFEKESFLTYYSSYSRKNCEMECEAKSLMERCNCVQYFMPRVVQNISICGIMDAKCIQTAYNAWRDSSIDCSDKCPSPCFELNYDPYIYATKIVKNRFILKTDILKNMSQDHVLKNIGIVHLYFSEKEFRSFTKDKYIGFTEFLSYIGGVVSLFLGFSLISGIEVLYYATLRPIFAAIRYRKYQSRESPSTEMSDVMNTQNYNQKRFSWRNLRKSYQLNSTVSISDVTESNGKPKRSFGSESQLSGNRSSSEQPTITYIE